MTLDELNEASTQKFIEALGSIFEHSPWVPEGVADMRPFANVDQLHGAMLAVVAKAGQMAQLGLIARSSGPCRKSRAPGQANDKFNIRTKGCRS